MQIKNIAHQKNACISTVLAYFFFGLRDVINTLVIYDLVFIIKGDDLLMSEF